MRRNSLSRQIALIVAGASIFFGVIVGFWPVSTTVVGDVSYSCGTGFVHSRSAWKADTRVMGEPQQAVGLSTATPTAACPSRVYRHRDIGYALIAIAVMTYVALLATAGFDPGATPVTARRRREVSVLRR